ncbi:SprT-like domain-containing protein [Halopenitus sp. H-Gu1]|uniref:SprT-like domain-containing protein n=1 Tax=Halopenitus sp. H-Gu1 TaxID=3242697 RepID=UPI00359D724C
MPPIERYAIDQGCTDEELLAVARVYARDVVAEHGLTVSVGDLDWRLSTRAKRRAGAVRYRDGDPRSIVLARRQFENRGWTAMASTIRHELVHVHLLNERDDPSHGETFERLAAELETHVRCERFVEPTWWVRCVECGDQLARYRRSKLVERPEEYCCGNCGGRFHVVRNE